MLEITIESGEFFNPKTEEFIVLKEQKLSLEHSLVSVSKWEMRWKKPFIGSDDKTPEQLKDYFKCMTITQNVDPNVYYNLSEKNIKKIQEYIDDPMTATFFSESKIPDGRGIVAQANKKKIITNELIYYWMIALEIPLECQRWHLNRLLTLIRVVNIKNNPGKGNKKHNAVNYAALNKARRTNQGHSG